MFHVKNILDIISKYRSPTQFHVDNYVEINIHFFIKLSFFSDLTPHQNQKCHFLSIWYAA